MESARTPISSKLKISTMERVSGELRIHPCATPTKSKVLSKKPDQATRKYQAVLFSLLLQTAQTPAVKIDTTLRTIIRSLECPTHSGKRR